MRFFQILLRRQRSMKIARCSHPWTGDAILNEKLNELNFSWFFFLRFFQLSRRQFKGRLDFQPFWEPAFLPSWKSSQVQGLLHLRFSSRAGDATTFEKNRIYVSLARAKNPSCSRGLSVKRVRNLETIVFRPNLTGSHQMTSAMKKTKEGGVHKLRAIWGMTQLSFFCGQRS